MSLSRSLYAVYILLMFMSILGNLETDTLRNHNNHIHPHTVCTLYIHTCIHTYAQKETLTSCTMHSVRTGPIEAGATEVRFGVFVTSSTHQSTCTHVHVVVGVITTSDSNWEFPAPNGMFRGICSAVYSTRIGIYWKPRLEPEGV